MGHIELDYSILMFISFRDFYVHQESTVKFMYRLKCKSFFFQEIILKFLIIFQMFFDIKNHFSLQEIIKQFWTYICAYMKFSDGVYIYIYIYI